MSPISTPSSRSKFVSHSKQVPISTLLRTGLLQAGHPAAGEPGARGSANLNRSLRSRDERCQETAASGWRGIRKETGDPAAARAGGVLQTVALHAVPGSADQRIVARPAVSGP